MSLVGSQHTYVLLPGHVPTQLRSSSRAPEVLQCLPFLRGGILRLLRTLCGCTPPPASICCPVRSATCTLFAPLAPGHLVGQIEEVYTFESKLSNKKAEILADDHIRTYVSVAQW